MICNKITLNKIKYHNLIYIFNIDIKDLYIPLHNKKSELIKNHFIEPIRELSSQIKPQLPNLKKQVNPEKNSQDMLNWSRRYWRH